MPLITIMGMVEQSLAWLRDTGPIDYAAEDKGLLPRCSVIGDPHTPGYSLGQIAPGGGFWGLKLVQADAATAYVAIHFVIIAPTDRQLDMPATQIPVKYGGSIDFICTGKMPAVVLVSSSTEGNFASASLLNSGGKRSIMFRPNTMNYGPYMLTCKMGEGDGNYTTSATYAPPNAHQCLASGASETSFAQVTVTRVAAPFIGFSGMTAELVKLCADTYQAYRALRLQGGDMTGSERERFILSRGGLSWPGLFRRGPKPGDKEGFNGWYYAEYIFMFVLADSAIAAAAGITVHEAMRELVSESGISSVDGPMTNCVVVMPTTGHQIIVGSAASSKALALIISRLAAGIEVVDKGYYLGGRGGLKAAMSPLFAGFIGKVIPNDYTAIHCANDLVSGHQQPTVNTIHTLIQASSRLQRLFIGGCSPIHRAFTKAVEDKDWVGVYSIVREAGPLSVGSEVTIPGFEPRKSDHPGFQVHLKAWKLVQSYPGENWDSSPDDVAAHKTSATELAKLSSIGRLTALLAASSS